MIIECPTCEIHLEGIIIGSYIIENGDDPFAGNRFTFLKCPKCLSPALCAEEPYLDYTGLVYAFPKQLYPSIDFHINPEIPQVLRESLLESIRCFKGKAYTACAVMCRRTIEGLCSENGIKFRNLKNGLENLVKENIINQQLYEWADELRISGNEAAHNITSTFTNIDAKDILDLTIAMLDYKYSFQMKFSDFKKRRSNKE